MADGRADVAAEPTYEVKTSFTEHVREDVVQPAVECV